MSCETKVTFPTDTVVRINANNELGNRPVFKEDKFAKIQRDYCPERLRHTLGHMVVNSTFEVGQ